MLRKSQNQSWPRLSLFINRIEAAAFAGLIIIYNEKVQRQSFSARQAQAFRTGKAGLKLLIELTFISKNINLKSLGISHPVKHFSDYNPRIAYI